MITIRSIVSDQQQSQHQSQQQQQEHFTQSLNGPRKMSQNFRQVVNNTRQKVGRYRYFSHFLQFPGIFFCSAEADLVRLSNEKPPPLFFFSSNRFFGF